MSDTFLELVGSYLAGQRWFAGKGRDFTVGDVRTLAWVDDPDSDARVQIALVDVESDGRTDVYQVPLSHRLKTLDSLDHAYIGELDDRHVYDALHDRDAVGLLADGLVRGDGAVNAGALTAHAVAPREMDPDAAVFLLTGEQSNTNVRVGQDLLLKVFRRVAPGRNPDIEVLSALTKAGSEQIVPLVGWLESAAPDGAGGPLDLAMLSDFLRTATDGWDLALTSLRDLFAERDLFPDEVGGDFASEAHRLGATAGRLHADMAGCLPTATWTEQEMTRVADRMRARLEAAVDQVPDLAEHAPALSRAFDALTHLTADVTVQRVHGDLHLGQALRTLDGWRIIDFEGEPASPLAERTALDSPVRDVAGMLRSFEYAAQSQWASLLGDHQLAQRASEWAERNRGAFLDGYSEELAVELSADADFAVLLRAYETDKAIYEAVYEARNRPSWLPIPMRAVARLAGPSTPADTNGGSS
jgi:maltokinase